MSQFYYGPGPQGSLNNHTNFGAAHHNNQSNHRSRRSTRFSSSQQPQRHFNKQQRGQGQNQKESLEAAHAAAVRKDFEAARSFDLEDDEMFCPWHLLTEDDLQSIHSSSSDRSSSPGSGSPDNSPLQHQLQPTQNFTMPPTSHHTFQPNATGHLRLHQPQAQRARNAIPIVDPNSRNTSPPQSVSPNRQAQKSWYGPRRGQW